MSTYVFSLNDISVEDGSPVVSVNNSDSFFGLIEGSQLFIAGKLPATIIDHDTTANTLTLKYNWQQGDLSNVAAQVVPIGAVGVLLQALENNRAAYAAFLENAGSGEVEWENITNPPQTSLRWPNFSELAGKISKEQLPDDIDTDNKKTQAMSPPVRQNQSLTHILSDYPTLKKTVNIPTYSPNNKREMLFDDVRQVAYVALTEEWLPIPNIIATREFLLTTANNRVYFNNAYTGNLTLRVYPMGSGGSGLPNSPSLANFEWHTVTTTVSNLGQFGSSFIGLIDFIQTDNGFETLSTARSHFTSIDAYYGNSNGDATINQFKPFSLRQDGHWYSGDVMPENPNSMGSSWSQDANDKKLFTVTNADGGSDALRVFNDSWDDYEFEIIIVTDIANPMALTISNSEEYSTFFAGTYRFITKDDRLYFKRRAGHAPITGSVRIESLRLRVAHYE
jgi:hypothetical protein